MNDVFVFLLVSIFLTLSLLHFYWLFGGRAGLVAALPERNAKPVFRPSRFVTLLVAVALCLCAGLIAATTGLIHLPLPKFILLWLCRILALVFLLRTIGDFRFVGFLKRVHGTRFAYLDSVFYSPLSLALAILTACVAVFYA